VFHLGSIGAQAVRRTRRVSGKRNDLDPVMGTGIEGPTPCGAPLFDDCETESYGFIANSIHRLPARPLLVVGAILVSAWIVVAAHLAPPAQTSATSAATSAATTATP
jgi:hypothetical protein